jgi:hypothetical protein
MKFLYLILLLLSGCLTIPNDKNPPQPIPHQEGVTDVGIIRNPSKSLPEMPAVSYHYPGLTDKDVRKSLKIPVYNWRNAIFPDVHYIRLKHKSFTTFNGWFENATMQLWHKKLGDGYDCDNYAFLYKSLLGVSSYKNNNIREVLVGVIYVKQEKSFGGIPGGEFNHALNIIYTDKGWIVYEPQTGKLDKLENYPNKIVWYIF